MSEKEGISVITAFGNEEEKAKSSISPMSVKKNIINDENKLNLIVSPTTSKNGIFFKDEGTLNNKQSRKSSILQQQVSLKMPMERRNSNMRKNSTIKRVQVKTSAITSLEATTKTNIDSTKTNTDPSNNTASEVNKMSTSNAQVDNARRRKFWGCMICYNRHNPIKSKYCLTCQQSRQTDRFVLIDKPTCSMYLAIADTASVLANVLLYCINSECQDDIGTTFRTILPRSSNILSECVNEAFKTFISNKNEPEENSIDDIDSVKSEHSIISTLQRKEETLSSPSKDWVKDPQKTLFEQVISNAQSIAYDSHIGRYIDSDIAAKSPEKMHDNLTYISLMKRASTEISKQVAETIKRRDYHDSLIYHYVPTKDEIRQRCNLCEFEFPLSQLVGRITFKTVANWKSDHGVPIPKNDLRLNMTNMHNPTAICLFCTQFFDAEFCDVIDTVAVKEAIGLDRRSSICKQMNFTNKAFKRIQQHFLEKSSTLEERPSSRMQTNLAVQKLKLRAEANNPNLRYQYNTQANTNNMIDQNKGGKYLREKYKDLGVLITEQKKQRKLDIEASERLMRLRNAAIIAKNNGTSINDALKSLNKSIGSGSNNRTSSAPAESIADGYNERKKSIGNNSIISNTSNTSSKGKRSILSSKKSRSASTSRVKKEATPKAYKRSLSSKPRLSGSITKRNDINSTLNSTGSVNSSSVVSSVASKSSRLRKLKQQRYKNKATNKNTKSLPRIKEKRRIVPGSPKNKLNKKDNNSVVSATKLTGTSNIVKNDQNPKLTRKPLVLLVKSKNINNTNEETEFTRIELPLRTSNLNMNQKSVIPPISTDIIHEGTNNIDVSEMSLDQYFDEHIPVQEGIIPSLFKVGNEFDDAYNDDFETDLVDNNDSSVLQWGDEEINIANENLDSFDGAGETIDSYAWATGDVVSAQNIQKECFSPDQNRPLSRLFLLSRGSSRASTSNSSRKLRNVNLEDNKMVMLSSPESLLHSKYKKKSKKQTIMKGR